MTPTKDELARLAELEDLLTVGLVEQPINGSVLSWGEAALIAHRIGRHLLRATPVADTAGIDAARIRDVRLLLIDGIGSDLSKEFVQGDPFEPFDRIYVAKRITQVLDAARERARVAAALRTPKPEGEPEPKRINWSNVVVDEGDEAP